MSAPSGGSCLSAAGNCIVVGADSVTIDLGGFTITGNGTGNGITDAGQARKGVVARNGSITRAAKKSTTSRHQTPPLKRGFSLLVTRT